MHAKADTPLHAPEAIEIVGSGHESEDHGPRMDGVDDKTALDADTADRSRIPKEAANHDLTCSCNAHQLTRRAVHPEDTRIRVGDYVIGKGNLVIIAGPCAVESEYQTLTTAERVARAGGHLFRGGAFKPRTSPYAFQGLGEDGLKILAKVRDAFGMPIVTEAMDTDYFDMVAEYTDVIQIGSRNMQNFSLLKRAGGTTKPILLKRGMASTIKDWLMAAEYILNAGNPKVILCERGVRSFVQHCRNLLDFSVVPYLRRQSHLPIIIDPSHAAGDRLLVSALSRAAIATHADGLMVEVHHSPEEALCDGSQSLFPADFDRLCIEISDISRVCRGYQTNCNPMRTPAG